MTYQPQYVRALLRSKVFLAKDFFAYFSLDRKLTYQLLLLDHYNSPYQEESQCCVPKSTYLPTYPSI